MLLLISITCFSQRTIEQVKLELKSLEEKMLIKNLVFSNVYLEANEISSAGLFTDAKYDGYNLVGKVTDTALIASFKDVVIKADFFSKTGSLIGSQNFTLYEFLYPWEEKEFKFKLYPPTDWSDYKVDFVSCSVY